MLNKAKICPARVSCPACDTQPCQKALKLNKTFGKFAPRSLSKFLRKPMLKHHGYKLLVAECRCKLIKYLFQLFDLEATCKKTTIYSESWNLTQVKKWSWMHSLHTTYYWPIDAGLWCRFIVNFEMIFRLFLLKFIPFSRLGRFLIYLIRNFLVFISFLVHENVCTKNYHWKWISEQFYHFL